VKRWQPPNGTKDLAEYNTVIQIERLEQALKPGPTADAPSGPS